MVKFGGIPPQKFRTYFRIIRARYHFTRENSECSMASTSTLPGVSRISKCNYCSFCSDDNLAFVKHLFQAHSSESSFHYVCGITNCPHTFKAPITYATFLTHCNRKHSNWREALSRQDITKSSSQSEDHLSLDSGDSPEEDHDTQEAMDLQRSAPDSPSSNESPTISDEDIKLAGARFLLTLKEKYRLTQASLNFALESVHDIIKITSQSIHNSVCKELEDGSFPPTSGCFQTYDPFSNLRTEYQQTKFYKDNFGLVVRDTCRVC